MTAIEEIRELQADQRERYTCINDDISRLPYPERISHLTHHLASCAAELAIASDPSELIVTIVDVFIISLSAADILEIELSRVVIDWGEEIAQAPSLFDLGMVVLKSEWRGDFRQDRYFLHLLTVVGRMAAACMALDHCEPINYKESLSDAIFALFRDTLMASAALSIELPSSCRERWRRTD